MKLKKDMDNSTIAFIVKRIMLLLKTDINDDELEIV